MLMMLWLSGKGSQDAMGRAEGSRYRMKNTESLFLMTDSATVSIGR